MCRISFLTVLTLLIAVGPAMAQLSAELAEYFDGPAGLLLTKDEAEQWNGITDDTSAEAFIELFWARRDPDLKTPLNEFRQDFNIRVEAADANFGYGHTRGAMSDRGRVLILLGRFSKRDIRAAAAVVGGNVAQTSPSSGTVGGAGAAPGYYDERGATEIWEYETEILPIKLKPKVIYAIFQESKIGFNDFVLDRALRENTHVQKLLKDLPEDLVVHPQLTAVPRFGLLPGSEAATPEQISWFSAAGPWPETARIVTAEGLIGGPRHFAWMSLFLPSSVATGDTLVGRLRSVDSENEAGTFAVPAQPVASPNGARYELAVPIESGSWAMDVAVSAEGEPLAVTTFEVETTADRIDQTMISPIYWGTEMVKQTDSALGDPFNVGGWHLVPPESSELTTADSVHYMFYVLNPILDESGNPQFQMVMSLYKDGKRVMRGSPRPVQLSKITDDLWMSGSGISLEIFEEPGEFRLKIEVEQVSDSAEREGDFVFVIAGPENAGAVGG